MKNLDNNGLTFLSLIFLVIASEPCFLILAFIRITSYLSLMKMNVLDKVSKPESILELHC